MAIDHEAHKIRIKAVSDRLNHPMTYNDAGAPKMDLEPTGDLKRTGRIGELMTEKARREDIKTEKRHIKENEPAGMFRKFANTDRLLSSPKQRAEFKKSESEKASKRSASEKRIKELKTRRK